MKKTNKGIGKRTKDYCRVSTLQEQQETSYEAQVKKIKSNLNCMAGKIDMVITKSISRFARNTVDSLMNIRELKEKNIAVFSEKEGINTLEGSGELLITILSSQAQEESRHILLSNEKYTGSVLLQKTLSMYYLPHLMQYNNSSG